MNLNSAIALEGYLEKKSPNIIKFYQKRYFTFRSKGQYLVWFKRKPFSIEDQPKGFVKVADIISVEPNQSDPKLFEIIYPERTFLLKADNELIRDRWVESIVLVSEDIKRASKHTQRREEFQRSQRSRAWRWDEANHDEVRLIRLENEKIILHEGEDSGFQNSKKFQVQLMGSQIPADLEKYALFNYFNRKNFLSSDTRWYFLCSEFNIYEEEDEEPTELLTPFLYNAQNFINKKKVQIKKRKSKESSSDSDSDEDLQKNQKDICFNINKIYEFDIKDKKLIQTVPLLEVTGWAQNTNDPPFSLTIKYTRFMAGQQKSEEGFIQQQRQLILYTNYLTDVKKWALGLKISFLRYSIARQRQKIMQQRFVRFKIKMFRTKQNENWRTVSSSQYVYLNREQFKIGGFTFRLENVTGSVKSEKIKAEEDDERKQPCCSVQISKERVAIMFVSAEDQKSFRKRVKKFIKQLQPYLEEKKLKQLRYEVEEVDTNTYYIDKKIRQTTSEIKINFYDLLEQDNSKSVAKLRPRQQSFFQRFLSMFCSPEREEDLY